MQLPLPIPDMEISEDIGPDSKYLPIHLSGFNETVPIQSSNFFQTITPGLNEEVVVRKKIYLFLRYFLIILSGAIFIIFLKFIYNLNNNNCNCPVSSSNLLLNDIKNIAFQNSDNICFNSYSLRESIYHPYVSDELKNREHCETIYGLGLSDFVYVCNWEEDISVVFTTLNSRINSTAEIALS